MPSYFFFILVHWFLHTTHQVPGAMNACTVLRFSLPDPREKTEAFIEVSACNYSDLMTIWLNNQPTHDSWSHKIIWRKQTGLWSYNEQIIMTTFWEQTIMATLWEQIMCVCVCMCACVCVMWCTHPVYMLCFSLGCFSFWVFKNKIKSA